ncbi:hypothetical protein APR41_05975 [Salegentibacter salinarum]|uniref:Cell surface protein n=1 Tax=Salegentibacter salinarum TaxID=447422 RepID=A0A2N0TQG7_9FLAO|nr:DUF5074 domain-containing protein [Salegentibacter salinarum]PKD16985.1 hypothetical protein APR41_05975 [Salegentibacter salinarum]SKB53330.1 hypothetical protein SAMN05660903_01219 [Salegentibacter salinarum]
MKRISKLLTMAILIGFFLNSCSSDDDNIDPEPQPEESYAEGLFVLNEGGFGKNNSSISYIDNNFSNLESDIFSTVNGSPLGDTGQSITFDDSYAYIVMNASNIVQIVNRYTFEHIHTIEEGLSNPRYLTLVDDNIYVTNWGDASNDTDDYIAIYNADTYESTETIRVGEGPEKIISDNNKVYVALQGGYNYNDKIVIIDLISNTVETSIEIGDAPNSIEISNGYLWVMSGGVPSYAEGIDETAGSISKVDLSTNEITEEFIFPNSTDHPSNFEIEDDTIYYTLNGSVYSMEESATELPEESLFTFTGITSFYGFEIENGYLYTGDAGDYSSNGVVRIYNFEGEIISEFDSGGVSPNGFYFND